MQIPHNPQRHQSRQHSNRQKQQHQNRGLRHLRSLHLPILRPSPRRIRYLSLLSSTAGSPYWMAPEVIQMQAPTTKSDIWSVGCLTLELLTGKPPYFNLTGMSALYHICEDAEIPIDDPQHVLTPECLKFIRECFQKNPNRRLSSAELLKLPWFAPQKNQQKNQIVIDWAASPGHSRANSRSSVASSGTAGKIEFSMRGMPRSSSLSKESEGILDEMDFGDMEEDFSSTTKAMGLTPPAMTMQLRRSKSRTSTRREGADAIENVSESKIVMSMAIVEELTKQEKDKNAENAVGVLEELLACCAKPENAKVIVKENGLYPLLTLIRQNLQNEKVCLLGMKVVLWRERKS